MSLTGKPEPKKVPNSEKVHIEESADGVTITGAKFNTPEPDQSDWSKVFERFGLSPDHFEIVGDSVRMSSWDQSSSYKGDRDHVQMYSFRAVFRRKALVGDRDISRIIEKVQSIDFTPARSDRPEAFIHAVGDLQLGKMDGDGTEGIVERFYASVAAAVQRVKQQGFYKHIHAAWLGDCVEGAVSQSGRNLWRTTLTLTEQIDLLENLMLHQISELAPLCERLTVVSVPGNHDEAIRQPVATRPDDSHAVQALRSVTKAIRMSPAFNHVETYWPAPDEMTVTLDVAGSKITHAHGHQWRRGKHWEWWEGQTFGGHEPGEARVLLCGHEHHHTIDTRSKRTFIRVPSFESESTWWRHKTGQVGDPGGVYMTTADNRVREITVI